MTSVLQIPVGFTWIAGIGSAGVGVTWGWLLAMAIRARRISFAATLKLTAATALLGGEVLLFGGVKGLLSFSVAAVAAILLHFMWLEQLKQRFSPASGSRRRRRTSGEE